MAPKNAKKANSDPKRDAKSVKEKENEVLPAGGGGADAKDRDGADAAQQKPPPGASAATAAGVAADAAASDAPENGAADADGDGGDGDGDDGDNSDADAADGDDGDGEDGLPLAQGAPPEYSVPLDSDSPVYGRYPDAGDDGLPVATARSTGVGGCCDVYYTLDNKGKKKGAVLCQKEADMDCAAHPGPRCSKGACLAAWHSAKPGSKFWRIGCARHEVPSLNAMKMKATLSVSYKLFANSASLMAGKKPTVRPYTLLESDVARILAIHVDPAVDDEDGDDKRAANNPAVPIAGPAPAAGAGAAAVQRVDAKHAKVQPRVVIPRAIGGKNDSEDHGDRALLDRIAYLEQLVATGVKAPAPHSDRGAADAARHAASGLGSVPNANGGSSVAGLASEMKSHAQTFGWTTGPGVIAGGFPNLRPLGPTDVASTSNSTGALPPIPGFAPGMDPLLAMVVQQHAGLNQRPVDHAAREITSLDQQATFTGQRWFDLMREHAKQYKAKYDEWVHRMFLEMVTHLERLLKENRPWEDPIVGWFATHVMALFYSAFGSEQSGKVLLFRGYYVSHTMTDRAAAHVVSAGPGVAKRNESRGSDAATPGRNAAKNKERRERQKAARKRDATELASLKSTKAKKGVGAKGNDDKKEN